MGAQTLGVLGLALLYFLAARLALRFALVHASASAVWPPTGIAIAVLLVAGVRLWPGVAIGAFLANLLNATAPGAAIGIAAGNTLEAVVAVLLLHRLARGRRVFERPQDIVVFAVVALGSTVISPTLGVTSLCLSSEAVWSEFGAIWLTWWFGDAGGALVVTPPLVLWTSPPRRPWPAARVVEVSTLVLATSGTALLAFVGGAWPSGASTALAFLCIVPLIAASFRLGGRGASSLVLLVAGIAVLGTRQGTGTFALASPNLSLVLLQVYLGVLSLMALVLSAVVSQRQAFLRDLQEAAEHLENQVARRTRALTTGLASLQHEIDTRRRVQTKLTESERNLARAQELSHLGSWHWDIESDRFTCSEELRRILGNVPEHGLKSFGGFFGYVHPDDRTFFMETLERSKSTAEPFGLEHRIVDATGAVRWLHGLGEILQVDGRRAMHGTARDITESKVAEIARRTLELELLELTYRERSRLGYHLQDDLAQLLTGISFLSKHVEQNLAAGRHPQTGSVGEIRALVKQAIEKTRSVARVLVTANLEGRSLQESLHQLALQTRNLFAISCDFQEPIGVGPEADTLRTAHLYRIAQEAISNAVRHGKAQTIRIRMWREIDDRLVLAVEDDGIGFGPSSNTSDGLGLPIMNHHAQLLGGELRIEPTHPGTRVLCRSANG